MAAKIPEARVQSTDLPPPDPEQEWLATTYDPNARNLTVRAVIVGILIGAVMCLSNIYVFFKTGWSLGVTLTACILGFSMFQLIEKVGKGFGYNVEPLGVCENNAMTTVASGAGYMTAGGNMAAYGALLMIITAQPHIGTVPSMAAMMLWFATISAMGVFAAIPIKRQLINRDGLVFPTGTATAATIKTLHAAGGGSKDAMWLGIAGLFGALLAVLRDALHAIPHSIDFPFKIAGLAIAKWTITLKTEVVLIGAGALASFRTGWSILLGGLLTFGVLAPELNDAGLLTGVSYKEIVAWTLWPGAAMLVGAGLTSIALDYKSLGRAVSGIFNRSERVRASIDDVEAPLSWFPLGFALLSPVVVLLMVLMFNIPWWAASVAIPMSLLMGFIAARVTGETDVTPTKAIGPVTQMAYGVMAKGNITGNIMSANVTGGIGLHAADMLTTMKTGWLLGAKPRHQIFAQLLGVGAGAMIVAPAFEAVIAKPEMLGSSEWPAPSCTVWMGVSKAFSNGIDQLQPQQITAIWIGLALGVTLTLLEKFAPSKLKAFIPSPNGLGIAMVIPCSNAIAMFLGAVGASTLRHYKKESFVIPVASGLIAGESIAGVIITVTTT